MAAANLKTYTSDGATLLKTMSPEANVGTPGTAIAFRLVNDDSAGAVDPALQPAIQVRQVDGVSGDAVERGLRAVDERWIEMRALGTGSAGDSHIATGWKRVGRGVYLVLPELASGGYHDCEIRYAPPLSAPEGSISFLIDAEPNLSGITMETGRSETSRDGIISGIGDGTHSELVTFGGITATGTPDNQVHLGDLVYVLEGVPYVILAHAETLNGNDGASVALSSGEAYWCRLTVSASGVQQHKSVKFTTSGANVDDVPAVPAGELDLGYVLRDDTAAIDTGDITVTGVVGRWAFSNPSGLILSVGPGRGRFDNQYVQRVTPSTITLPASTSGPGVNVWAEGDSLAVGASRPSPRAYLLCTVDTGSSSITMSTLIDYRDPIGAEQQEHQFYWSGVPAANTKLYAVHRSARTGYLRVPRGLVLRAQSLGTGNTAGELRIDIKINGTTVFTSGVGAGSRAPGLKWNDTSPLDTNSLPEVLEVPPFALIEAKVTYPTAFDGTGPNDLVLLLTIEVA